MSATVNRIAIAALLLGAAGSARAQAFEHAGTIYADLAGVALKGPEGVACAAGGSVVVADTGNGRLLTVSMSGKTVANVTEIKLKEVVHPTRVRVAKDGTLLVLDRKKKAVARIADGKFVGWLDVPGEPSGRAVVSAFALDGAGNVFLLDAPAGVLWAVDPTRSSARKIALPGAREALIVDVSADEGGTVQAVDALGRMVWVAPPGATALKPLSKSLKDMMSFPGYAVANKGRLYVVDQNGGGVVVLGPDGTFLGRRLSLGWNEGLVRYPGQICFNEGGQLFVADRQNNRVQAFSVE